MKAQWSCAGVVFMLSLVFIRYTSSGSPLSVPPPQHPLTCRSATVDGLLPSQCLADTLHLCNESIYQGWDGSKWVNWQKIVATFDDVGRMSTQTTFLAQNTSSWALYDTSYLTYFGPTNQISESYYHQLNDNYEERKRFTYERNCTGLDSIGFCDTWDTTTDKWAHYVKDVFFYNADGRTRQIDEYYYVNNTWIDSTKFFNTYDSAGRLVADTTKRLHGSMWKLAAANQYKYRNDDSVYYFSEQKSWDWVKDTLLYGYTTAYVFGADGKVVRDTVKQYANNAWVNYIREDWTYDAKGNATQVTWAKWDAASKAWTRYVQITNKYIAKVLVGTFKPMSANKRQTDPIALRRGSVIVNTSASNVAYEVFDLHGRLVQRGALKAGSHVSLRSLDNANGLLIFRTVAPVRSERVIGILR